MMMVLLENAIVSTYNVADEDGDLDWGFYRLASGDYITDDNGLTIGLKPTDNQKHYLRKEQRLIPLLQAN